MPSLWNDNLNLSELRLLRLCGIDIILLFYWPEVSCFFCVSFNATRLLLLLHDLSSQTYQKKNESKTKNKNIKTKTKKNKQAKENRRNEKAISSFAFNTGDSIKQMLWLINNKAYIPSKLQSYSKDATQCVNSKLLVPWDYFNKQWHKR